MVGLEIFDEDYVPKELLFRDREIEEFKKLFDEFEKTKRGANYMIYGYTGTGKTAVISKVSETYKEQSIYISGAEIRTSLSMINQISKSRNLNPAIIISECIRILKENPKVLIIDEMNDLKDPNNLFDYLDAIWRATHIPIIFISNNQKLALSIPDDAIKTLMIRRINLSSYNAVEMKEIINERLKLLEEFKTNDEIEGFVNRVSAYAAQSKSAKVGLFIIKEALIKKDFTAELFDKTLEKLDLQDFEGYFKSLTIQQKEVIRIILERASPQTGIQLKEIYKHPSFSKRHPSRISQIIKDLEITDNLLTKEYVGLGKGRGMIAIVKFMTPEYYKIMFEMFEKDGIEIDTLANKDNRQRENQLLTYFDNNQKEVNKTNGE